MKTLLLILVAGGILFILLRRGLRAHKSRRVGWRVGHVGRHGMYYEELVDGKWARIAIDGEILVGPTHHIIYFASEEAWHEYPAWARDRRSEIVSRIKTEFCPPAYKHHGG
jgi:hypothetical protein